MLPSSRVRLAVATPGQAEALEEEEGHLEGINISNDKKTNLACKLLHISLPVTSKRNLSSDRGVPEPLSALT